MCVGGEHKIANGRVKKFLRDAAVEYGFLPRSVAERPKLGVHEGSGVDAYFSRFVGSDHSKDYSRKNIFSYRAFEAFFIRGVPREDLDPQALLRAL